MPRYADVDKLIKELSTMYKSPKSAEDFMTVGYDHAIADVVVTVHEHLIADVVEQNSGTWIYDGEKRICPFCKDFIVTGRSIVKYCWNCGARLKERSKDAKS